MSLTMMATQTAPATDRPRGAGAAADERLALLRLLLSVSGALADRTVRSLEQHGLMTADLDVLVHVRGADLPRMGEVATAAGLTPGGATRVVDRLADRGLVTRVPDEQDRRTTYVRLTTAGRALLEAALPAHVDAVEQWLTGPLREAGRLDELSETLGELHARLVADGRSA